MQKTCPSVCVMMNNQLYAIINFISGMHGHVGRTVSGRVRDLWCCVVNPISGEIYANFAMKYEIWNNYICFV